MARTASKRSRRSPRRTQEGPFFKKEGNVNHDFFSANKSDTPIQTKLSAGNKSPQSNSNFGSLKNKGGEGDHAPGSASKNSPAIIIKIAQVLGGSLVLRKGSRGDIVKVLQRMLIDEGFALPKFGADGAFGNETRSAVIDFQGRWRLKKDGRVGKKTFGMIATNAVGKGLIDMGENIGGLFKPFIQGLGGKILDKGQKDHADTACDAANKAERMVGCIQPVLVADDKGGNSTSIANLSLVKSIWEKCCINYTIKSPKIVKKTSFLNLDESKTNTPTVEAKALFAKAGSSPCIQVFVPRNFVQDGVTGKRISGGGATYDGGKSNAKIVVVEGALAAVIAHEVGHATGFGGHDGNNTVMKPTGAHNKANSSAVSDDVCKKARTGSIIKKLSGEKDCCIHPK